MSENEPTAYIFEIRRDKQSEWKELVNTQHPSWWRNKGYDVRDIRELYEK